MTKPLWIRTVYLYLFSLLGLVLLIIGGVGFISMGLKAFVFTQADEMERINFSAPYPPMTIASTDKVIVDKKPVELTAEEKTALASWVVEYKTWQERQKNIDYVTVRRHQEAARNLALILVGLPLFITHWLIIRKENKGVLA